MNLFSERLKTLREEAGLTQIELADSLSTSTNKISPQNISYWEKGREPSFDVLNKLGEFFNATNDYLTGRSKYKNIEDERRQKDIDHVTIGYTPEELETNLKDILKAVLGTATSVYNLDKKLFSKYKSNILTIVVIYNFILKYFGKIQELTPEECINKIKFAPNEIFFNLTPVNEKIQRYKNGLHFQLEDMLKYLSALHLEKICSELFLNLKDNYEPNE